MLSVLLTKFRRIAWRHNSPADYETEEGRAQERQRRVILTAGASALARAVSIATALVSVPLTLHYLGTERYGMWMVISSFMAILGFADLGVGNGVLTLVSRHSGTGNLAAMRSVVSSAFVILTGLAFLFATAFAISYPWVAWFRVFNVSTSLARSEAGPAIAVFISCFLLSFPLAIVQKVQIGLQQGFSVSLWQIGGNILGFLTILLVIYFKGGLPWLVLALVGVPQLAALGNNLWFFVFLRPELRPNPSQAEYHVMKTVLSTGLLFLILQLVVTVTYSSDSLIITQLLGASAVATYAIPEKMFSTVSAILSVITAPLWPAFGEAITRGDRSWVRRMVKRSILINAGLAAFVGLVLVLAGPILIKLWVGHTVSPPLLLLLGFAVWKICESVGSPIAMLLNGAHVIKPQIIVASLTAVVAVSLKIVLISHVGVAGAVWATSIAYCACALIPLCLITRKIVLGRSV